MRTPEQPAPDGFHHEAFLYAGADDFVSRSLPVIAHAVDAGQPVMVAVDAPKIELLRDGLGAASSAVAWKDIRGIGANPARIIPIWRQFVDGHRDGRRLLGVGEPVWAGRTAAELVEAQQHERLLNLAFAWDPEFTLLCPYDTLALGPEVIQEAHRSHPVSGGTSEARRGAVAGFDDPLPEPAGAPAELLLDGASAAGLRRFLADHTHGLDETRADDLTIAAAAVTTSMGRPGGRTRVRVWREPRSVVAEIAGLAPVGDPLAGREWPPPAGGPSRGVWLANQVCDLVQLRSGPAGAVVRLHVAD